MRTVVSLGGGRITSALIAGLRLAKKRYRLVVYDRNSGKLRSLKRDYQVQVESDLQSAVKQADLLIIAVRPDSVRVLLNSIERVDRKLLAVSLAAGIPLKNLRATLGPPVVWSRAMPSPVCRIRRGLTALTFPRSVSRADRRCVRELFLAIGQVIEIPERMMDAFTVTYSSSHGYHALAALANAAQDLGLDRQTALLASSHALADGITAWRESGHSLESLLEEAATPGGIAATTMAAMDGSGYSSSIRKGLRAGLMRARANARK